MDVRFDSGELRAWSARLSRAVEARDGILREIAVAEGVYAVERARRIARIERGLFNTGLYRRSFHTGGIPGGVPENKPESGDSKSNHFDGSSPELTDTRAVIHVYNNVDYASALEYGFRRRFVPGYWKGKTFVYVKGKKDANGKYIPGDGFQKAGVKPGGMMVGPKPAHNTLSRALAETERTQRARVSKTLSDKLNSLLER